MVNLETGNNRRRHGSAAIGNAWVGNAVLVEFSRRTQFYGRRMFSQAVSAGNDNSEGSFGGREPFVATDQASTPDISRTITVQTGARETVQVVSAVFEQVPATNPRATDADRATVAVDAD
jgi:hypothetical protein